MQSRALEAIIASSDLSTRQQGSDPHERCTFTERDPAAFGARLVVVVVLLFKGEYPRSIFDLELGFNRSVLRVGALMSASTA
jgi:hypothetical protein